MTRTFGYLRPATSEEACELKAKNGKAAQFWAGGTDLLLAWRDGTKDFEYCIDLSYVSDLDFLRYNDGHVCIGSLTKVASLEEFSEANNGLLALAEAACQFASPQIRNIATIGGNLCHAAPSADLATPLLVLDAEAKLMSTVGERHVALEDFFKGVNETALRENEFLAEVRIPIPPYHTETCFLKLGRTAVDIALVNTAVRFTSEDKDTLTRIRIALGAVAPVPMRSKAAEELLIGVKVSDISNALLDEVGSRAAEEAKPITDIRASAEYRRKVSKVLVRRATEHAVQRLRERMT